jgi:hypothetical protein
VWERTEVGEQGAGHRVGGQDVQTAAGDQGGNAAQAIQHPVQARAHALRRRRLVLGAAGPGEGEQVAALGVVEEVPQLDLAPELRRRAARRRLLAHDPSVGPAGGLLGGGLADPGYARTRVKSGRSPRFRSGHSLRLAGRHRDPAQSTRHRAVTTKRSNMSCVNGAVPTTIIVAGLALAGYALLMTALNRRMSVILLAALGVLEILLLVQVGLIVARLAGGERPAGLATLIGYLIAMPLVPVAAAFWGLLERSRWGPAVIAVAGLVAAVLVVRLHQIWPVIRV